MGRFQTVRGLRWVWHEEFDADDGRNLKDVGHCCVGCLRQGQTNSSLSTEGACGRAGDALAAPLT
jgi:hypothetical protein